MIENDSLKKDTTPWWRQKETIMVVIVAIAAGILYKTGNWNETYNYGLIIIVAGIAMQNIWPDKLRYKTRGKILTPSEDYSFHPEAYVKRLGLYVFSLGGYTWGQWPPQTSGEGTIIVPEELVISMGEHKYFIMGDPSISEFVELPSVAQDIINDNAEFEGPFMVTRTPTWEVLNIGDIEDSIEHSLTEIEEAMQAYARRNTELRTLLAKSREDYEEEADHIKRIQDDSSKLGKIFGNGKEEEKERPRRG